jgi:hypothetical protein
LAVLFISLFQRTVLIFFQIGSIVDLFSKIFFFPIQFL